MVMLLSRSLPVVRRGVLWESSFTAGHRTATKAVGVGEFTEVFCGDYIRIRPLWDTRRGYHYNTEFRCTLRSVSATLFQKARDDLAAATERPPEERIP
jgi:hypothetical protein